MSTGISPVRQEDKGMLKDYSDEVPVSPGKQDSIGTLFEANVENMILNNNIAGQTRAADMIFKRKARKLRQSDKYDGEVPNSPLDPSGSFSWEAGKFGSFGLANEFFRQVTGSGFTDFFTEPIKSVQEFGENFGAGLSRELGSSTFVSQENVDNFFKKMQDAYKQTGNPEFNFTKKDMKERITGLQNEVHDRKEKINLRNTGFAAGVTKFLGSMGGAMFDPVNVATLPIGASYTQNILKASLIEGGIEMGIEAAQQPRIQEIREDAGLNAGVDNALANIAFAGAGGTVLNTVFQGGAKKLNDFFGEDVATANINTLQETSRTLDTVIEEADNAGSQVRNLKEIVDKEIKVRQKNPYDNRTEAKVVKGLKEHRDNINKAQKAVQEKRPADIDKTENPKIRNAENVDEIMQDEKVQMSEINFEKKPRMEEQGTPDKPVFYKNKDGEMEVLEGRNQIGTAAQRGEKEVNGIVLKEDKGVNIEQARSFVKSRRLEQGRITKQELADEFEISSEEAIPERSFVTKAWELARGKPDEFVEKMVDNKIPVNIAKIVSDNIDDEQKQLRAMDLFKDLRVSEPQARGILNEAETRGFENVDPASFIKKRSDIITEATTKLSNGQKELEIDGSVVNLDDTELRGLRRIAREGKLAGYAANEGTRVATRTGSTTKGTDRFIEELETFIERGNISRTDISSAGRIEGPQKKIQFVKDPEKNLERQRKKLENIRKGESEKVDELRNDLDDVDESETFERTNNDGDVEEISVKKIQEEIEEEKSFLEEAKDCLV